jgi:hypothetical protein
MIPLRSFMSVKKSTYLAIALDSLSSVEDRVTPVLIFPEIEFDWISFPPGFSFDRRAAGGSRT